LKPIQDSCQVSTAFSVYHVVTSVYLFTFVPTSVSMFNLTNAQYFMQYWNITYLCLPWCMYTFSLSFCLLQVSTGDRSHH